MFSEVFASSDRSYTPFTVVFYASDRSYTPFTMVFYSSDRSYIPFTMVFYPSDRSYTPFTMVFYPSDRSYTPFTVVFCPSDRSYTSFTAVFFSSDRSYGSFPQYFAHLVVLWRSAEGTLADFVFFLLLTRHKMPVIFCSCFVRRFGKSQTSLVFRSLSRTLAFRRRYSRSEILKQAWYFAHLFVPLQPKTKCG